MKTIVTVLAMILAVFTVSFAKQDSLATTDTVRVMAGIHEDIYVVSAVTPFPMRDLSLARTATEKEATEKMFKYLNDRKIEAKKLDCYFLKDMQPDGRWIVTAVVTVTNFKNLLSPKKK